MGLFKTSKGAKRIVEKDKVGVTGDCAVLHKPSKDFGFYPVVKAVSGLEQKSDFNILFIYF